MACQYAVQEPDEVFDDTSTAYRESAAWYKLRSVMEITYLPGSCEAWRRGAELFGRRAYGVAVAPKILANLYPIIQA
jgi:hypothetical protein